MMNYYHKLNLLSDDDYKQLMVDKENIMDKGKGAITIHEDGSITIDTRLKENASPNVQPNDYIVSKESIFNLKHDIESFTPFIGDILTNAMTKIQLLLQEQNIFVKPTMARCYRNNIITPWHKHLIPRGVKPSKFWVAIYYMHPNWDPKFKGDLKVGLTEKETVFETPCFSNSLVLHNGYFGHGVEQLILGYEGDRDIFLTHWVNET